MGVYKLSTKSEIDLSEMYEFGISEFGLLKAQTYFYEMHEVLQLLANNAALGRDSSEFIPMLRRFAFKAHTIFYLAIADGIFIVRVLSQRIDYAKNL